MDLNTLWFILIAVLFIGYFVLEGFDLGVGIWLPFLGKDDNERRMIINTIGPHWDGNEVWLITGGGAYNTYLIERIREKSSTSLIIPEKETVDFKEALIFAFMAVLKINGENNVLSSATGSTKDHCTGLLA